MADDFATAGISQDTLSGIIGKESSFVSGLPDASSGGLSAGTLGLGALGVGGLAYMMGQGPSQVSSIPYFAQANAQVPTLQGQSALTFGQGQRLVGQAGDAYAMAQRGELTPEQAAQNKIITTGEENTARQMYASMGRDYNKDTSAISTQQQIDLNATARAQAFIQSTIALATSEMGAGQSLLGLSLNESNAATNILMQEGQAQIQMNKQYSDSLSSAFKAVGTVFGAVAGAVIGGPAGASLGATVGGSLGSLGSSQSK